MDRSEILFLITTEEEQDAAGIWKEVGQTRRRIFCRVKEMNRQDWHNAGRDGLNPGLVFFVFAPEYRGEEVIEYKGRNYYIYRTHEGRDPDELELYTTKKSGRG